MLSTPAGDLELRIPKLREGSFFPSLLEPRRRVDRALWAVIMTAYVTGTSTRKVESLVKALGVDTGVSKSTVSRICAEIDTEVEAFRSRPLNETTYPYVWLDATYLKARKDHRIVSRAVVVATAVTADGNREVLDLDIGDSEDEVFWTCLLAGSRSCCDSFLQQRQSHPSTPWRLRCSQSTLTHRAGSSVRDAIP